MANHKRLGELLVSLRLITPEQLQEALESQRTNPAPLGTALVRLGYLTEELLLNALAAQFGVWPWRLEERPVDPAAVRLVPGDVCRSNQILPVALRGDLLLLAMVNPHDIEALDLVRGLTGMRVEPVLADPTRLVRAIGQAHGAVALEQNLDDLVDRALKDFRVERGAGRAEPAALSEEDTRPVVGLVNQILSDAIRLHASDVHIEPARDIVEVRYRIDGRLRKVREIPASLMPMLATRMKIMAELDIVETRLPQDGRVSVQVDARTVDLRVSVLPSQHGGRIVLRVLDKSAGVKDLSELGFAASDLQLFKSLVAKPYGMFLVTGPTGSGKTTTLYAALSQLRDGTNNVITCEDPIEYEIEGVSQSQVNEKVGLTFARQLRAILRQDPDVILVGEIRDGETAETAVRAALTGHMVLSTLHCNDAPSAIPRLLDMGIDPYLLSTTLIGVMSQRLVRQLCPRCKSTRGATDEERELMAAYGARGVEQLPRSVGCHECGKTGFRGRAGVHEIMALTPDVASCVAAREPVEALRETARQAGYTPMQVRALRQVLEGRTTLEEAQRVVFFDTAFARSEMRMAA